jgi:hypothetical protein
MEIVKRGGASVADRMVGIKLNVGIFWTPIPLAEPVGNTIASV